jgi:hypothetical protein
MSLGWIRRLRDRPIGEHERRGALAVVAVVGIAATLLLALAAPETPPSHPASTPSRHVGEREAPRATESSSGSIVAALRAARRFLHGYLAYIYGHGRAAHVSSATSTLARSLASRAPRVPPSMRARRPRVLALHAVTAPTGVIEVTALINDGGLVDYPIELRLAGFDGRLLVAAVGGA